ncbi:hypothetical protein C0585_04110 [Candidatus Woesearchaeota archaeon]|nr:MAG: hypothetical protein C0585_04110 [Candidatus Woesearchaeota archaeon]
MGLKRIVAGTLCGVVIGTGAYMIKPDIADVMVNKFEQGKSQVVDMFETDIGERANEMLKEVNKKPGETAEYRTEITNAVKGLYASLDDESQAKISKEFSSGLDEKNKYELANNLSKTLNDDDSYMLMSNVHKNLSEDAKADFAVENFSELPNATKLTLMKQAYDALPDNRKEGLIINLVKKDLSDDGKNYIMKETIDNMTSEERLGVSNYIVSQNNSVKESGKVFLEAAKNYAIKIYDKTKEVFSE